MRKNDKRYRRPVRGTQENASQNQENQSKDNWIPTLTHFGALLEYIDLKIMM